jgi:stage V sporulation protein G
MLDININSRSRNMKISDVRVRIVKTDKSKIKASASITIDDCIVVHDIKIIDGEKGLFVSMPSRKTPDGEYKDIVHPINTETREVLVKAIFEAYETAKNSAEAE